MGHTACDFFVPWLAQDMILCRRSQDTIRYALF